LIKQSKNNIRLDNSSIDKLKGINGDLEAIECMIMEGFELVDRKLVLKYKITLYNLHINNDTKLKQALTKEKQESHIICLEDQIKQYEDLS